MTIPLIAIAIIVLIVVLIIGLLGMSRMPGRLSESRIGKLILQNTTLGDRLSEIFYGIAMVSVVSGMVNYGFSGQKNLSYLLFVVALGVNISWGIIDGATAVYGGLVDRAEEDRLVSSLRTNKNDLNHREDVNEILEGTILHTLNEEDRDKVVDMISAGEPRKISEYSATADDLKVFFAILLMDFITVFPVIIPLYAIDDSQSAIFWSHLIAVLLFALIGAAWAKYLNKSMVKAGLTLGAIGAVAISLAYYFGW
jgi:VIT1/CCC1 family predicted Fe2+/Mn2+ transporter